MWSSKMNINHLSRNAVASLAPTMYLKVQGHCKLTLNNLKGTTALLHIPYVWMDRFVYLWTQYRILATISGEK